MFLNDTKIRNLKPKTAMYRLSDGNSLFLQVEPTGSKYWRFRYRYAQKEKTLALGTYPEVSLAEAREKTLAARKSLAAGLDPGAKKQEDKRKGLENYLDKVKKYNKAHYEAYAYSICIKILAPIVVESFINFVIFSYAKKEVKNNKRDYDGTIRDQIDLRIIRLSRNCNGFTRALNIDAPEYKKIQRLFSKRNDWFHGNVDPAKMAFSKVYFDEITIPLFENPGNIHEKSIEAISSKSDHAETVEIIDDVGKFIFWVSGHLEKKYQDELERLLLRAEIGWREKTGRLGILFPDFNVDIVGPSMGVTYDSELA